MSSNENIQDKLPSTQLSNYLLFSVACAIELEDTVVVTGGDYPSVPFVNTYNIDGHQEQPVWQDPEAATLVDIMWTAIIEL